MCMGVGGVYEKQAIPEIKVSCPQPFNGILQIPSWECSGQVDRDPWSDVRSYCVYIRI